MLLKLSLIVSGVVATLYIAFCLLLRNGQTKLIFLPHHETRSTPQAYGWDYQDVWLDVGEDKVHGWWLPASNTTAPTLLYFHGNGSNNGDLMELAAIFRQLELSVFLIDYRGYGQSSPVFPNENRVYEDAEAAWQYLVRERKISPEKIVVYGHSLGGAIAIELATQHPEMAGLITEGTFTSIADMARLSPVMKLLPLSWVVTQRFDSIAKVGSLQMPILILHGTADEVIPFDMSEKLYAAAPQPKQREVFELAGHSNLPQFGGKQFTTAIARFVRGVAK